MLFRTTLHSSINLSHNEALSVLKKRAFVLFWLAFMHSIFFYIFEPNVTYFDCIWVTFITFSTVGYGDISAVTIPGKISTIVFATLSGIYFLAITLEAFVTWTRERRESQSRGKWNWNLNEHILICNFPKHYTIEHMKKLIKEIRKIPDIKDKPIQIITNRFEGEPLPRELLNLKNVVHYDGIPSKPKDLKNANIHKTSHVLILSLLEDNNPDGYTFDTVNRIRDYNRKVPIIAQCENEYNSDRIKNAGATAVVKPLPSYPEAMALVLSKPYNQHFIEDFISSNKNELTYFDIKIKEQTWKDIIEHCIKSNFGLPIAYKRNEQIIYPENINKVFGADGIFVLKHPNATREDIANIIKNENKTNRDLNKYKNLFVLNSPTSNGKNYFLEMEEELKKHNRFSELKITLVSDVYDETIEANKENININIIKKDPSLLSTLEESEIKEADFIFILSNDKDNHPDSYNFDIVKRLRDDLKTKAYIVTEIQEDYDRNRIIKAGSDSVIRPMRSYPAMLVRAIASKGSEKLLENIFDFEHGGQIIEIGDKETKKVFKNNWSDLVVSYYYNTERCLLLGYSINNKIIINPNNDTIEKNYHSLFLLKPPK